MKENKFSIKKYILAVFAIILCIFLDQYTKLMAIGHLKGKSSLVIWEGVFELEYLENRGAAFGLFQNQRYFFVMSTIVILVIAVYFFVKMPNTKRFLPLQLCTIFLVSGAIGNFIDRISKGYVVDFFYFSLIDFPIFNVADIYVTVTFIVLAFLIFFVYKEEELQIFSIRKAHSDQQ